MEFQKTAEKEFLLQGISLANLKIDQSQMLKVNENFFFKFWKRKIFFDFFFQVPLKVKSKNGFKVSAPLGSSFCCYDAGVFAPHESGQKFY